MTGCQRAQKPATNPPDLGPVKSSLGPIGLVFVVVILADLSYNPSYVIGCFSCQAATPRIGEPFSSADGVLEAAGETAAS